MSSASLTGIETNLDADDTSERKGSTFLAQRRQTYPSLSVFVRGRRARGVLILALIGTIVFGMWKMRRPDATSASSAAAVQPVSDLSTTALLPAPPKRGVVIRTGGLTQEGIGSAVQHFKMSIVLAELMDRELVLSEIASEHKYSLSDTFNDKAAIARAEISSPVCVAYDRIQKEALHAILDESCEGADQRKAAQDKLAEIFKGCGTILHQEWDELREHLNGCTEPWVKRVMLESVCGRPNKRPPPSAAVHVGIHLRWGDVATEDPSQVDWVRAMRIEDINAVVASVKRCGREMRVRLFAEGFPESGRNVFDFPHELVDSGNDVQDLCEMGKSDVLIAGGSSFAVLGWQLSWAKVAVISDQGHYKYYGTERPGFVPLALNEWRHEDICTML
ncbi:hypothetical protein MNV49_004659 [Pseudohyphozyma bogoriensis]|nr:hypothetical protein MNV49_004659 [Pseudohyphozyma bogoriensis]